MKTTGEDLAAFTHTQPHTVQHIFHASGVVFNSWPLLPLGAF